MFILPFRYAMVFTALGLGLAAAVALMMLDLLGKLMSGEPFSIISWMLGNFVLLLILMVVVAVIITAITWGYWLGDLGNGPRRRDVSHTDEERDALDVLERKYANKEITMTDYLALKRGIEKDRPKY